MHKGDQKFRKEQTPHKMETERGIRAHGTGCNKVTNRKHEHKTFVAIRRTFALLWRRMELLTTTGKGTDDFLFYLFTERFVELPSAKLKKNVNK